ncbi:MAG: hypothetical protein KatS3mg013_0042 [Actinomycetota bacterium]|jgi:WhiB family redox-sensing transcriptional regulator|nr:MAG: hypothetical protein KatS3mg013_0042 [Actinomycetota bacterium]
MRIERTFKHDPALSAWMASAACAGEDPELFFPTGSGARVRHQVRRAKLVCERCPVRPACLEWSLVTFQDAGVWGGLDEEERRAIRRARRAARAHARSAIG